MQYKPRKREATSGQMIAMLLNSKAIQTKLSNFPSFKDTFLHHPPFICITMRYLCLLLFSLGLFPTLFGQFTYEQLAVDYGSAVTFENLQLIPIRAKDSYAPDAARRPPSSASQGFITLRDAMARGLIRIRDRAGVNRLLIDNLSDVPVMLLSGEILKGGRQDRIIGQDMVLPPNSRRNRVPVFCVEENRWSIAQKEWSYYHEGSMHLRRVVDQSQDQRQVWREVKYELERDNVPSRTRAYTSHSQNASYAAREQAYLRAFAMDAFPKPESIVGIMGVSGSVVLGCDVFATANLFADEYQGIIFSYIDEAITYGLPVSIDFGALQQYSDNLFSNERMQRAFIQQYGKAFTYQGEVIHITTFNDRESLRDYESLRVD